MGNRYPFVRKGANDVDSVAKGGEGGKSVYSPAAALNTDASRDQPPDMNSMEPP